MNISQITVTPQMELHELIELNNRILILMEHFDTGFCVADKSIETLCKEKGINPRLFASLCNIYNGNTDNLYRPETKDDVDQIIMFLENAHRYYINEMYPEIKFFIGALSEINNTNDIKMVEMFFESYFAEVRKHLEYEQKKFFPIVRAFSNGEISREDFLSKIRKPGHDDIESKLGDLKSLLLKHIKLIDSNGYKRKLIAAILEFQFDLSIHSLIEDEILRFSV